LFGVESLRIQNLIYTDCYIFISSHPKNNTFDYVESINISKDTKLWNWLLLVSFCIFSIGKDKEKRVPIKSCISLYLVVFINMKLSFLLIVSTSKKIFFISLLFFKQKGIEHLFITLSRSEKDTIFIKKFTKQILES